MLSPDSTDWLIRDLCRGSATISQCGAYRYDLTRDFVPDLRASSRVTFCMLNPSKADATKPDPTMRRCLEYAKSWGFRGFAIVNLFAFRATKPRDMWKALDPIGPTNDDFIMEWARNCGLFICAWGAVPKGLGQQRASSILRTVRSAGVVPHAIQLTKDRHPGHPLFLRADLSPFAMEIPNE
jgi:hypothetical protein